MKTTLTQKPLIIKKSSIHGYGVFAQTDIYPDEIIEECYVLQSENNDIAFANYYFAVKEKSGIPLGFGSIYNHSDDNNARYFFDEANNLMIFCANKMIPKDSEIFVSYGNNWFSSRHAKVKEISFLQKNWRFFCKIPLRGIMVMTFIFSFIFLMRYFLLS